MTPARLLAFCVCLAAFAQDSPVTGTQRVSTGGGKTELLRKINGRWWSQDNREVYPPSKTGFFWELDSKPGVVDFYHHRPFRLDLSESLHMFMQPSDVQALLGQPNRIFGRDSHANWYYYASNGTKLDIRFMGDGLGEAEYQPVNGKRYSVATIEQELGGRSIYTVLAERATRRSNESRSQRSEAMLADHNARVAALRAGRTQSRLIDIPATSAPTTPERKQIVSADSLASITPGIARADVLAKLGEPSNRSSITGDKGTIEFLVYHRESGETVTIQLLQGKVTQVR